MSAKFGSDAKPEVKAQHGNAAFAKATASRGHLAAEEAAEDIENAMGDRSRNNAAPPGRD